MNNEETPLTITLTDGHTVRIEPYTCTRCQNKWFMASNHSHWPAPSEPRIPNHCPCCGTDTKLNNRDKRPYFGCGLRTVAHGLWYERGGGIAEVREYRPISSEKPWVGIDSDGHASSWKNNGQWCTVDKQSQYDLIEYIGPLNNHPSGE